jgi:2-oxo-3-hexenedioate decarboxylase
MFTAQSLLEAMDRAQLAAPDERERLQDLSEGQRIQAEVNALRLARGDKPLGFKIGFTNRALWPVYNVFHPIWAPVWDRTVYQSDAGRSVQIADIDMNAIGKPLSGFSLPRLEPEIVLGLRNAPASSALDDVANAVDWVAHGFEIVQSAFPDWSFSAAESFAAQGLHGALLIGPRRKVVSHSQLPAFLSAVRLNLCCNGDVIADGDGTAVLDGPVQALAHLVEMLGRQPPLAAPLVLGAGSIITTGTMTDAQPLLPRQHWQSGISSSASPDVAGSTLEAPLVDLRLVT